MNRKAVIIGAGHVGSHCALQCAMQGVCREVVLLDCVPGKAAAQAADIADALVLTPGAAVVRAGGYSDVPDADILILSIGMARKPGQTRLDLLDDSLIMLRDVTENLNRVGVSGIVISITNPADVIADQARKALGLPRSRVFSTGTALDTLRMRRIVAELAGVSPASVQGVCLGEHGDSSVVPFSALTICGLPYYDYKALHPDWGLDEAFITERTHQTGMDIIEGKGSTEFGIGAAAAEFVSAVLLDKKQMLPASVLLSGEYGISGIHIGVPCIIGANGIEEIIELPLRDSEQALLYQSRDVIAQYAAQADGRS